MHWIYAHLIGDCLIQTDWMAKEKKTSSFVCFVHVFTYIIPFVFCGLEFWQLILILIQHFIQDRTTIVNWFFIIAKKENFAKPPMAPWSIILVDNIFHILFIAFVISFGK